MLHVSTHGLLLGVHAQVSESLCNLKLLVVVEDALVHVLLALAHRLVAVDCCKGHLEKPLFSNATFDLTLNRLEMEPILAKCEPVVVAAGDAICVCLALQLLGLQAKVLHDQALVDESIEDLGHFLRL